MTHHSPSDPLGTEGCPLWALPKSLPDGPVTIRVEALQKMWAALDRRTKGMTRHSDGDTPRLAAQKVLPRLSTDRARVKECLETFGPMTDFQLAERLGGQQTSLGKRRLELKCVDTGLRRPSPSGSPAVVWRLP